jgi:hypothetical protein
LKEYQNKLYETTEKLQACKAEFQIMKNKVMHEKSGLTASHFLMEKENKLLKKQIEELNENKGNSYYLIHLDAESKPADRGLLGKMWNTLKKSQRLHELTQLVKDSKSLP